MREGTARRYVRAASRYFLALLFLATGIGKLLDNRGFSDVLASYRFELPETLLLPLALAVSLAEFTIGLNILLGRSLLRSVLATLYFHLAYASLAMITLLRGISLTNCGCFGVFLVRPLHWTTVVEDLMLAAISLGCWLLLRRAAG
ncbi:MAG: MauE/DoxX family redox-associated membrane protein [Gammaproteobacteria bacterium]